MRILALLVLLTVTGCRNKDTVEDTGTVGTSDVIDLDSDGSPADEDCDDGNGAVYPGNAETPYNGLDDDCDETTPDDDLDGDGSAIADDCDDEDPTVGPDFVEICDGLDNDCNDAVDDAVGDTWYADGDQDGFGDAAQASQSCDGATGYVSDATDCDDTDPAVNPAATEVCNGVDDDCDLLIDDDDPTVADAGTWYHDGDGDGFGDEVLSTTACEAPSSYVAAPGDCDDSEPAVNPDATEVCNDADDDCDGLVDADDPTVEGLSTYWLDVDEDGVGGDAYSVEACDAPDGFASTDGDCDDSDADVFPGGNELCNGGDDDCDGDVDENASDAGTWYYDVDGDGYGDPGSTVSACDGDSGTVADATDCHDGDASIHPGAAELCNGTDDDCDGLSDDDDPDVSDSQSWYSDADGDGYGDPAAEVESCSAPSGTVADDTDCDDGDSTAFPGAAEVCDGDDEDCDALIDDDDPDLTDPTTWYLDHDGDSYGDAGYPVDSCSVPAGYVADDTDCDDTRSTAYPGGSETCDGLDNDCDSTVDEDASDTIAVYTDSDGDGFGDPATASDACEPGTGQADNGDDCDDVAAAVNPDAEEVCDGTDNDCDGDTDGGATDADTWVLDFDGDGFGGGPYTTDACSQPSGYVADSTDCDDGDAAVNPDASEVCNGVDDDCDTLVDGDDTSLDASTLTTWYTDADGDGYGDPASGLTQCDAATGRIADDTDCDDAAATTFPGATELCDWVDQDCDGTVDEDLPDGDSSGVADCKEVGVLVTVGFQDGGGSYSCEGVSAMERELIELQAHLGDLGLTPVFHYDSASAGITYADVGHYGLLIHHNGGWSTSGSTTVLDTLNTAKAAGTPLMFMGDDLSKHAAGNESSHGDRTIYDLTAMTSHQSNGSSGHDVGVVDASHPLIDGPHGVVGDFWYTNDLDELTLAGVGEQVLMQSDTSGEPVIWVWEDGSHRTAVLELSVYESHACPISDGPGLVELEVLFQNSVSWLTGL